MLIQILIQLLNVDTNAVQKLIQIVDTDILEARGKLFAHGPGLVKHTLFSRALADGFILGNGQ